MAPFLFVGPGSEANWGYEKGKFSHLAEVYMQEYIECGHPVFNPEFIYETMEPHFWRSAVREEGKQLRNPDGSWMYKFDQDIHFLDCSKNYDIFCAAIAEIASMTQLLGCLCDVARVIDVPFDITRGGVRRALRHVLSPDFGPGSSVVASYRRNSIVPDEGPGGKCP